jgi:hypothetical protein
MRLPRWVRILVYIWIAVTALSLCNSSRHEDSADIPPAKVAKLKAISEKYQGTVADGSVVWSKSYPAAGADPAKIAAEVDAKIPPLEPK